MLSAIAGKWWVLLLRGIFAVLFGVFALVSPGITLWSLIVVYGVLALADGTAGILLGIRGGLNGRSWGEMLLLGLLGVVAGLVALFWPGLTAIALLYVIAWWAIFRGVVEIIGAIKLRKVIDNEWWLVLSGLLSVVFGFVLLARPGAGALAVVWLIGAYMIAFGLLAIALSFKLRGLKGVLAGARA